MNLWGNISKAATGADTSGDLSWFFDLFANFSAWFSQEKGNLLYFAIGLFLTLLLIVGVRWFTDRVLLKMLARRTKTDLDDNLVNTLHKPVACFVLLVGLRFSLSFLNIPTEIAVWIPRIFSGLAALDLLWAVLRVVDVLDAFFRSVALSSNNNLDILLVDLVGRVAKITIWVVGLIFIAQNIFNLNVAALLVGAGVVGLGVAFAAQNTIANLFGTVTIVTDKPFTGGDRVKLADADGVIEDVGLRSTRIRSLDGTLWCVPNAKITDSLIENISRRTNIKYVFTLGLTYSTTPEKMEQAIAILHEILDRHEAFSKEQPALIQFTNFGAYSLDITCVVWFQTTDFVKSQNWKNEINLEILKRFNAEGLDFAFPTNTTHLIQEKC